MPRYPSRAYKPGHYSAYPRERSSSRNVWKYSAAACCLVLLVLFLTSSPRPDTEPPVELTDPFGRDPIQRNQSHNSWHEDPQWLIKFSDSVTHDRSVPVLPPSRERPPIYAYFDDDAEKDEKVKESRELLVRTWQRAWWVYGFKPVVLGRSVAAKNPLYDRLQTLKMNPTLEADFTRCLAWAQSGAGILSDWTVYPMDPHGDPLISNLRAGTHQKLQAYEDFGSSLLAGDALNIQNFLGDALKSPDLRRAKHILELSEAKVFSTDPKPKTIAVYSDAILADKYKSMSASPIGGESSKSADLHALASLIASHLHLTFLHTFTSGIAVLAPHRHQSFILEYPALSLAKALSTCPSSPLPGSCPPNNEGCVPCAATDPLPILTPESYTDSSTLFTIGTIPHPYTLTSLLANTDAPSISHVRRYSTRDPWLRSATQKILGATAGGFDRILTLKKTIIQNHKSLWLLAESPPEQEDIHQHLGFALPLPAEFLPLTLASTNLPSKDITKSLSTIPTDSESHDTLTNKEVQRQRDIVKRALGVLFNDSDKGLKGGGLRVQRAKEEEKRVLGAVEGWCLADREVWEFVGGLGRRGREEWRGWGGIGGGILWGGWGGGGGRNGRGRLGKVEE